jgi:hypothetical protein
MKKIVLLILIVVVFAPSANAFSVKFENTTTQTLIYRLYWLTPDWLKAPKIAAVAVGELKAGKEQLLANNYKPGPYAIKWENLSTSNVQFNKLYGFKVEKDECTVVSTPEAQPYFR